MTLKNNRTPLLSNIKLCASFHHHMWIQTGVTVRKRLSWVLTSVTLTFDLWPWPFAWTLLWSLVITPENFMMIRWWEHSEKGGTDGQTDGQTDNAICRAAWSQLKHIVWKLLQICVAGDAAALLELDTQLQLMSQLTAASSCRTCMHLFHLYLSGAAGSAGTAEISGNAAGCTVAPTGALRYCFFCHAVCRVSVRWSRVDDARWTYGIVSLWNAPF